MVYSHPTLPSQKPTPVAVRHLTLEYRGFRNVQDRREYVLCARLGAESREYTVWIANAAFAAGHALFQDGPDISYQKLRRELAEVNLADVKPTGGHSLEVTPSDLLEYRTAHLPPQRRGFSKPTPSPEKRD